MHELLRRRDLRGALNLLDVDMKREYVKPNERHFRLLIHACGKEGYHSRAFSLYRSYRRLHFRTNYGVLADLFNACTNSPFPEKALEDARVLRKSLVEQNLVLPEVTYNNMIKAFGRCGDLETAFSIVDEMARNGTPIKADTFHHLLHGCISDRESGFRHAILAWRKLLEMKRKGGVSPEVFLGQICKVCASFILLGSNSYLLGFHRTVPSAIRALIHGEREGQAEAEGEGEGEGEGDRGDAKEGKSKVP